MTTQEIIQSIQIGFCQPKFYKRSVWNKAKKVMEFLCDNTNGEVVRHNFGPGMGKYTSECDVPSKTLEWALLYKKSLAPLTVTDALPLMEQVAEDMGLNVNNGKVLVEFFKRYPNLK
jgi:hypothetical protein